MLASIYNKKLLGFIVIIFVATAVRLAYLLNTDNSYIPETYGRMLHSIRWLDFPSFGTGDWLPLMPWLIGSIVWLTNDIVFFPRLTIMIFSIALFYPLFQLTKNVFSEYIAWLSIIIFCLSGFYIVLSTVTLTAILFSFFVLISFYKLQQMPEKKFSFDLLAIIIAVNAACLLRYEGLIINAGILLALIFRLKISQFLLVTVFTSLGSLFALYDGYVNWGNPLEAIFISDEQVKLAYYFFGIKLSHIIDSIDAAFPVLLLPYFLLELAIHLYAEIRKLRPGVHLTFLLLLAAVVVKIADQTLSPQPRYYCLIGLLAFPYALSGIHRLLLFFSLKNSKIISAILLLVTILCIGHFARLYFAPNSKLQVTRHLPKALFESAKWAHTNIPNARVAVGWDNWQEEAWLVHAKRENGDSGIREACYFGGKTEANAGPATTNIERCLSNGNFTHLVLFPQGTGRSYFNNPKGSFAYGSYQFIEIHKVKGYQIFRAEKLQ